MNYEIELHCILLVNADLPFSVLIFATFLFPLFQSSQKNWPMLYKSKDEVLDIEVESQGEE